MKLLTIDVGGTAVKYAVMDESLSIFAKGCVPTPQQGFEEFADCICGIYSEYESSVCGMSISMPGFIDSELGYARTGGWLTYNNEKPVGKILSERCKTTVYVENDGKCALLSEMWRGSLSDCDNAAVMLLGTGLGGGIMLNGKLYKGKNFSAGEFSYINSRADRFGNPDNMAGFTCSATGLINLAEKETGLKELDGKKIFQYINGGDERMLRVLDEFSMRVAVTIFNLNVILDLEKTALGGGISREKLLLEYVNKNLEKCARCDGITKYNPSIHIPQVVQCKFFNDSNMVGAMYHYLSREGML